MGEGIGESEMVTCTPGSAPGPTLGNEYGKPLPLPYATYYGKNWLLAY